MFLVSDSLDRRAGIIRDFLRKYPSIAVVIAATYFEWTVSRALIALSRRPNNEVREALGRVRGLPDYSRLWWDQLQFVPASRRLTEVVSDWAGVNNAFKERNALVHGHNRHTRNMATPHVEALLKAVEEVYEFGQLQGVDLGRRLPVRKNPKRVISIAMLKASGGGSH
jgi:hypothetical protein